jgi:hypothetical protein
MDGEKIDFSLSFLRGALVVARRYEEPECKYIKYGIKKA